MAAKTKTTGTSMVEWNEEMAKLAASATSTESHVGAGSFIQLAGGILKFKCAEVPGNKMNVVVLDHILENDFFEGNYDPANPTSPICYAFGRTDEDMKPHEDSPDAQNETCAGCPQNEFGTANTGRGKACKNTRRLAMITEGDLAEDISRAEVAFMKIPVTSIKGWAGYVRQLADVLKRPPLGVVTEISVVPDAKTQFKVKFELHEEINDGDIMGQLIARNAQVQKDIAFPYVQIEAAAPPPKRGRNVVPARAAAKGAAAGKRKF